MTTILDKNFSPVNVEERKNLDLRPGDTVRITQKIKEGDKTRSQAFEGIVISKKHGTEPGATFTLRKVSYGIGVERVFPLYSPVIQKIEVLKRANVRRAKLYYIREKAAKEARRKMRQSVFEGDSISEVAAKPEEGSDKENKTEEKSTAEKSE